MGDDGEEEEDGYPYLPTGLSSRLEANAEEFATSLLQEASRGLIDFELVEDFQQKHAAVIAGLRAANAHARSLVDERDERARVRVGRP